MGLTSKMQDYTKAAKEAAAATREAAAANNENAEAAGKAAQAMYSMSIMATEFTKASQEAKKALLEQTGASKEWDAVIDKVLGKNEKLLDYVAQMNEALDAGVISIGAYLQQMNQMVTQLERQAAAAKDGGAGLREMANAMRELIRETSNGQR